MLKDLINRPVLTLMTVLAISVPGFMSMKRLPVSLVPEIEIPEAVVMVSSPDRAARDVYETLLKPLIHYLSQVPELTDIRCEAEDGHGTIQMRFGYGVDMGYVMMDLGERIDRAMYVWPGGEERPAVSRISGSDIPAFYIDVTLLQDYDETKFAGMSTLVREVIMPRLEQLPQVAMVDASDYHSSQLRIIPDEGVLESSGISPQMLSMAIIQSNITLGGFTVKDGVYEYNVRYDSSIGDCEDVENVWLNIGGRGFQIKDIAKVKEQPRDVEGMIISDGKRAVSLAVIKRSDSRMSELKKSVSNALGEIAVQYPEIAFKVTRDQTGLLDYSIGNMVQNLLYGALFALIVVFLFMNNLFSSLLVSLSIPVSLMLSFLFFRLLGMSFNILSLSGLIMGMGMMVDNAIVVMESILEHLRKGKLIGDACVSGTREVVAPMFSSVLTTCAMFLPLSLMSGMAGTLFHEEALAVTVTLFSSLVVSVIIIPVFFCYLYRKGYYSLFTRESITSRFFGRLNESYARTLSNIMVYSRKTWIVTVFGVAGGFVLFMVMDKEKLPEISRQDILLKVGWNENISATDNKCRCEELIASVKELTSEYTCMSGRQQFKLPQLEETVSNGAAMYIKCVSQQEERILEKRISEKLKQEWPLATFSFRTPGNVFDMLFPDDDSELQMLLRTGNSSSWDIEELASFISSVRTQIPWADIQPVELNRYLELTGNPGIMALYNITPVELASYLCQDNTIMTVSGGMSALPVVLNVRNDYETVRKEGFRMNFGEVSIPFDLLLKERYQSDLKVIRSDSKGEYYPVELDVDSRDVSRTVSLIRDMAKDKHFSEIELKGSYFSNRVLAREMSRILGVSVLLLFLILAAQFESLLQPLIVLSELIVDMAFSLGVMWLCNISVNIMSMTGIIVMCGIVINDSILNVDTMNRLNKSGVRLEKSITEAGRIRFKTILMTSATTILTMIPFLFKGDMGSDLQYPLSVAVIAGLSAGTLASIFLIPLEYYRIRGKR